MGRSGTRGYSKSHKNGNEKDKNEQKNDDLDTVLDRKSVV